MSLGAKAKVKIEPTIPNELLVAAVKKRKPLYDRTDENYSNRAFISTQWKEIGDELGINDQDARKRWISLRDSFVKTLRSLTNKTPDRKKKWYLYDAMRFLQPYMPNRKTCSNISDNSDDGDDDEDSQISKAGYLSTSTEQSSLEFSTSAIKVDETSQQANAIPTASSARKRKSKFPQELQSSQGVSLDGEIREAIKRTKLKTMEQTQDEEELFLLSLAPKLRMLDPLLKTECQAEMQMLLLRYMQRTLKSNTT